MSESQHNHTGSKRVYENKFFSVREERFPQKSGDSKTVYIVDQAPFVIIIAATRDRQVYLVGQYRYTSKMFSLEFPAGGCETVEPILDGIRELKEETGLVASTWQHIGTLQIANGTMQQFAHILLAQGLKQTEDNKQSEDNICKVRKVRFELMIEMIMAGKINDSDTVSAALLAGVRLGWLTTMQAEMANQ